MMKLETEQYEEIKQIVSDTFVEYGIKATPINAFEMAYKMGIQVMPYSSFSVEKRQAIETFSNDGFSVGDGYGRWTIYYNDLATNYGRINQTIMHEIGHYALGHIESGEREEAEANFFAKYALAPPPLIHKLGKNITIKQIMNTFDISYTAAMYACNYYKNWLDFGGGTYKNYELQMLQQFNTIDGINA